MSRNTEHQFIPTDTDSIISIAVAMYEALTGTVVHPASPEMQFIRWVCNIIIQERVLNNYTGNQNVPSRAEGENLDALAELTYLRERPDSKAATCKMLFSISEAQDTAILIPAGTRITDANGTLTWETIEDIYVPIGETSVETQARCQTVGVAGNGYAAGQINALVDVYDYYSECKNVTASEGGADRATDDEYYELMRASMDAFSCAGGQFPRSRRGQNLRSHGGRDAGRGGNEKQGAGRLQRGHEAAPDGSCIRGGRRGCPL